MSTNRENWAILTKRLTSPQTWIDAGLYFMMGAALQRRVWLYGSGEDGGELFPNLYLGLVGPPGLGKGLVIGTVNRLLRHHKYEKGVMVKTSAGNEHPPLFPIGADSITFEKLLDEIADNTRRFTLPDGKMYIHSSYVFLLEELDSLFKRKTQDVVNFMKNAYDCKGYEYKTRHQATQLLRNLCVSLLAGTQPDFLFEARKSGIFGQGFASRTLFLFETQKRFSAFHLTQLDAEQKRAETELLAWLKRLATVYGEVRYSQATYNYLESWERDCLTPLELSAPPRMREYFARKKVNMLKLAVAMHFTDSLDLEIPTDTFVQAINWMDSIEPKLEQGLGITGRNELHGYTRRVHEFILGRKTVAERDVLLVFGPDMNIVEIRGILEELETTGQIQSRIEKQHKIYYI